MLATGLAALASRARADGPPLVFAAASLKAVLDRVSAEVIPMRLAYGGSGAMARQIIQGAPADLFMPANPVWMEAVALRRAPLARRALLGNTLVMVARTDITARPIAEWQEEDRLAMGFVEAVPAGQYGKAALQAQGLWQRAARHVVETDSVTAALALVTSAAVPYAIVYTTDALAEPRVKVIEHFSSDLHPPITYPLALVSEQGRAGFEALSGPKAGAIFRDAGFKVL